MLLYVERIYDQRPAKHTMRRMEENLKVHTIYENQQENDIKLLGSLVGLPYMIKLGLGRWLLIWMM